jgi:hypothetical protein
MDGIGRRQEVHHADQGIAGRSELENRKLARVLDNPGSDEIAYQVEVCAGAVGPALDGWDAFWPYLRDHMAGRSDATVADVIAGLDFPFSTYRARRPRGGVACQAGRRIGGRGSGLPVPAAATAVLVGPWTSHLTRHVGTSSSSSLMRFWNVPPTSS